MTAAGRAFGAFGATYYVKPTATGSGDGTSWTDATTIADAIGKADVDEIRCLAGTYPVATQLTIGKPLALKGGYAGTDDETLAADPVSTLDGQGTAENVVSATAASGEQTFLRMAFVNGKNRGFNKSGAGAITLVSCRFANNGTQVSGQSGRGAYFNLKVGKRDHYCAAPAAAPVAVAA